MILNQSVNANTIWSEPFKVGIIEAGDTGVTFYTPNNISEFSNPFSCKVFNQIFFKNELHLADRALAIGLSAQARGKKVKYYINGCHGVYISARIIIGLP